MDTSGPVTSFSCEQYWRNATSLYAHNIQTSYITRRGLDMIEESMCGIIFSKLFVRPLQRHELSGNAHKEHANIKEEFYQWHEILSLK